MSPVVAYVGLGSNLDEPLQQVREALASLAGLARTQLRASSSFYVCTPWGMADQPDFINAVARIGTSLDPQDLLAGLLAIEQQAGRVRNAERWGPRRIDLDLLLYGDQQIAMEGLQVPHPRIAERAFVLLPLAELDPLIVLPGQGRIADLLQRLDLSGCNRLPSPSP
ncbi:MAG: 2-amino-4-hydroxy-6-hydroxymethyldihydropteridine diphosphokinase [Dokdonella sp.]|mgnify:CR=1 FL=1|uniref:2-amino-4-hydroxy-6- hydroxymethyldihydropteridine diphosphokinase n=1 Tax=Dokdonella sp. TaxID=2291710 RepID=UPI002B7D148A|nr:2-amino-4-hydroxy-6-hydroxymethyldihydropteridine diphosphokinase [Dokdonella sp.]HOX70381.1 2-amino-4-hydroxy-6-hydroxymethyldihydropteridine diphosphokinase [Dokdonella sp.]HPG94532.1 2-amino-4-hydroxy-6-hydroxymethyldihydropteridine diphosphokinase [Dokdonella sp.]HPN80649.1 2-amino-4-hydroxy-6-hydroxymethyldihydropteridine diphosphokinase [Dokdonella sp.]